MLNTDYVLITSVYNEDECISGTIEAVLKQTIKPLKWVIVSDGSTDNTDAIVKEYAKDCNYIEFVRREKIKQIRGFISKVEAIKTGYKALESLPYEFIGILDGDITIGAAYYENVLSRFHQNKALAIAGGFVYEPYKGEFKSRLTNTTHSVAGGIQLFRRECYEAIGGHQPALNGGEDSVCEIMARMMGWQVESFPHIIAYHHKPGAKKRGLLREAARAGAMDYTLGIHPLFEMVKCVLRLRQRPYILGSLTRFGGFLRAYSRGEKKIVSREMVAFIRSEEWMRFKDFFISDKSERKDIEINSIRPK
jgi:glycosyltransferase involved in cell wall biosynthesis